MNKRFLPIIAGAAVLVGSLAASGLVSAAPNAATGVSDLLAKVAVKLGITDEKLATAFKDARVQQLDEALATGKITQAQHDAMKQRIKSGADAGFGFPGGPRQGGDKQRPATVRPAMVKIQEAIASAIGISAADLKTALAAAKTPVQVALEKGIDQPTLKTKVLASIKTELSAQVTAGKVTQEQADKAYDMFSARIDDMLTKAPHMRAPGQGSPSGHGRVRPGSSNGTAGISGYSLGSRSF